jgi:hypothetical protein
MIQDRPGYNYTVINATGATNIPGAEYFGGYQVLAAAGAYTMDVYDNTAASGQKLVSALSVNSAASLIHNHPIRLSAGLTVNLSDNPTDGLILVFWK